MEGGAAFVVVFLVGFGVVQLEGEGELEVLHKCLVCTDSLGRYGGGGTKITIFGLLICFSLMDSVFA